MYRMAVVGVFATVAVIIAADLTWRFLSHGLSRSRQNMQRGSLLVSLVRILVNAVGLACLVAAAITGFIPVVAGQPSLSGYLLIIHVTTAGGFAVAGAAVAVLWVSRNRFVEADREVPGVGARTPGTNRSGANLLRRASFWIALASAVPALATALLAMFPLASPAEQQGLFEVHRIFALSLAAGGVLFAYSALSDLWTSRRD